MEGKTTALLSEAGTEPCAKEELQSRCKNGEKSSIKSLIRNDGSKSSSHDLDEESRISCLMVDS
jgi:hypothetical protein